MLDKEKRKIDYMRISITDRCNLRCTYCMPEDGVECLDHKEILSYEEIVEVVKAVSQLGIHKIRITGGEPLVRKDVHQLIEMIKQVQGIEKVTLTTNAVALQDQLDALISAGLDSINISIDTLDPYNFRLLTRGGDVQKVKDAIVACTKYPQLKVKLNAVAMQSEQELKDLVHFAHTLQIPLRFIEVMPIGLGKNYKGNSQQEIMDFVSKEFGAFTPSTKVFGEGPATYYQNEDASLQLGFISAMSHKFCASCNRIRMTADGSIKGCLQYHAGNNVKEILRSANFSEAALLEVLRNVIANKPKEHHFSSAKQSEDEMRDMHTIGG